MHRRKVIVSIRIHDHSLPDICPDVKLVWAEFGVANLVDSRYWPGEVTIWSYDYRWHLMTAESFARLRRLLPTLRKGSSEEELYFTRFAGELLYEPSL